MKMNKRYIITGVNVLTGQRDQLSGPMGEQEARERLEREKANRRYMRHQTHKRLRVEHYDAVQLTFQFEY